MHAHIHAQLEGVVYALQQHERQLQNGCRAGFFIGDGTGVGKGRELAAIVWENWLRGRTKAVWFTCNTDLALDARRDLDDIGASDVRIHICMCSSMHARIDMHTQPRRRWRKRRADGQPLGPPQRSSCMCTCMHTCMHTGAAGQPLGPPQRASN